MGLKGGRAIHRPKSLNEMSERERLEYTFSQGRDGSVPYSPLTANGTVTFFAPLDLCSDSVLRTTCFTARGLQAQAQCEQVRSAPSSEHVCQPAIQPAADFQGEFWSRSRGKETYEALLSLFQHVGCRDRDSSVTTPDPAACLVTLFSLSSFWPSLGRSPRNPSSATGFELECYRECESVRNRARA